MNAAQKPHTADKVYDKFFQENYDTLQRWASQITNHDRALAEDLVHDVYVRFLEREEPLADVNSVPGYLYSALKNAHISFLRRKTRANTFQLSVFDYELADNALPAIDPRANIKVEEDLKAICEYVCSRKDDSISASIVILRFFHGYFSAEVVRIVKRSRNAVEARLLNARRELISYLSEPSYGAKLKRFSDKRNKNPLSTDLLSEIRERIFLAAGGICISRDGLYALYKKPDTTISRHELSHLVSCKICLENVNRILRMPALLERHPLDSLGPQKMGEIIEFLQVRAASLSSLVCWFYVACIFDLDQMLLGINII